MKRNCTYKFAKDISSSDEPQYIIERMNGDYAEPWLPAFTYWRFKDFIVRVSSFQAQNKEVNSLQCYHISNICPLKWDNSLKLIIDYRKQLIFSKYVKISIGDFEKNILAVHHKPTSTNNHYTMFIDLAEAFVAEIVLMS